MSNMDIRLLGSMELEIGGSLIELRSHRERKLLAVLALNANQLVSANTLEEVLWEGPPPTARQQIYNVVASIRRALKPVSPQVALEAGGRGYRLRVPPECVDVHRFRDLVAQAEAASGTDGRECEVIEACGSAVALWRGPALDGLDGRFVENIAVQLDAKRLHAIEILVHHRLRSGASAELVGELQGLVVQHPLHESFRAKLMAALIGSGRRAEALAVFQEARRELADELGLDPGPELLEMQRLALDWPRERPSTEEPAAPAPEQGAQKVAADETAGGGAAPTVPGCSLPRDIADFTARVSQVEFMLAALEPDTSAVAQTVVVHGMGGTGKTTLAVHIAHSLADRYPDGQFFVDLQGFTAGATPLRPGQALEILLRDSGVPAEQIPVDAELRGALWRARLKDRRVLLVLDNAVDEEQVLPMLPNTGGSGVIVTSRRRLPSLDGAALALDCMSASEACELFARIVGDARAREQLEAIADVIEVCGRLPLAVRIAAVLLRDRTAWHASYLARKLRTQGGRSTSLDAYGKRVTDIASLSYAQLTREQRNVFRLLGATPCTDFDAYGVAALADCTVDQAEQCLEALLDDSLLIQRVQGRYQFHDVIRGYAREIWVREQTPAEADGAVSRLLDYYLCLVARLCHPLASRPYRFEPRLTTGPKELSAHGDLGLDYDVLTLERTNITAMARLAADVGRHRQNWELTCLFQPYLRLINFGDGADSLFECAYKSAQTVDDGRGASLALFSLSRVVMFEQDLNRAQGLLSEALELCREAGDDVLELYQTIFLGTLLYERLLPMEACQKLESARALPAAESDADALAVIDNNLGIMYRDVGRYDAALEKFTKALNYYARHPNIHAASTYTNVGLEYLRRGELDKAESFIGEGLSRSNSPQYPYAGVYALLGLAAIARTRRDYKLSVALCRDSLNTARDSGLTQMEYEVLIALGDTMLAMADLESARECYRQAHDKCVEYALRRTRAHSIEGLAHVSLASGDTEGARAHWMRALEIYPAYLAEAAAIGRHLAALDAHGAVFDHCEHCPPHAG